MPHDKTSSTQAAPGATSARRAMPSLTIHPTPAQARAALTTLAQPWRWSTLLRAPHRLSFFVAMIVMVAAAVWWWLEILARAGGWRALPPVVPPVFVHALVMTLGFMPLFFCGFLFTAGPKWLQLPEVNARDVLKPLITVTLGWVIALAGVPVHHLAVAAGVALASLGWLSLAARFSRLVRKSRARDRLHAKLIASACIVGVLCMATAAIGLAQPDFMAVRMASLLGLWWFIVPVFVVVAHRMLPFFSASALPALDAWRPNWLLWALLIPVGLQGVWVITDALGWQGQAALTWVRGACSAACGLLVLALALRWGLIQSLRIRLLAMLHLGFVWLGLAQVLDAVSVLLNALGAADTASVHLLPLHAMTMGFLGSVIMAMVTRVSCGHSGRTLVADDLVWGLFWTLQVATLLRLFAVPLGEHGAVVLLASASVWLVVWGVWALRHARWYGQPRVDGKPG